MSSENYSARLELRERAQARWDRIDRRLESARLLFAAAVLVCAGAGIAGYLEALWLLMPAGLFVGIVVYHLKVRRRQALSRRAAAFYRIALERSNGQPYSDGPTGDSFADVHHLYGADLDLFGRQGLYGQLCTARTPMGESTLARWLLAPADLATIHARHACVRELRDRVDLREDLAILGEPPRIALHTALERWADGPAELTRGWLPIGAALLALAAVISALAWAISGVSFPFVAVLAAEAALTYAFRDRVHAAVAGVEDAYEDLRLLAVLLQRIEAERFDAPELRAQQAKLSSHSRLASATLSQLATRVNFVEARRNPFLTPVLLPLMYGTLTAVAAERWRRKHGRAVAVWLQVLGDFEALTSIASYSARHPTDPFPEFCDGPAVFVATQLGHPLIPAAASIRNDVELSEEIRVLLVSGSNMSGKSTLLRSVGMNTVLAMAGAPVRAQRLRLTPLQVGASIRVNDSLHEGSSRFYAEITRLRQLFETAPASLPAVGLPLLFLLDELLQGTNSTDRRIGAQGLIRALLKRGAIGLVSTHDLALTDAELAGGALRNVHFQDELTDGTLRFDFKLRDGVVTKSNGIELMRAIGLDV